MDFKPYVWNGVTTSSINSGLTWTLGGEQIPQTTERPKLELIDGGRIYLGREESLLRAMRTVEEKEAENGESAGA